MAKAGDGVEREANHFVERIFGLTCEALASFIRDRLLPKANPDRKAAHKTMLFPARNQHIHDAPIKQAKIARIAWNTDRGDALDHAIERRCCEQFETRLSRGTRSLSPGCAG